MQSQYLKLSEQECIATMSHENYYVSVQERLASLSQGRVTTAAIAILAGIGLIVYGISILAGKHWSMLHNVILIVLFASYRHAKWLFCVIQ